MTRLHGEQSDLFGRNDPCPCGSGKKNKKCCSRNQATERLNEELILTIRTVLQEFFDNHPSSSEQKELLVWKDNTEDLLVPLYGEDKSGSIIGDIYFFLERVDIWNSFIERQVIKEERLQLRQILEGWVNPAFLVGEILSVAGYRAQMRDLLSEDVYEIDVNDSFPVEAGNVAIGFYLPFILGGDRILMALNSVTLAIDVKKEPIQKLRDMSRSSEAETVQEFYKRNILTVYQIFSSGLRSNEQVSNEVLEVVNALEQFMIEEDLKSDDLMEGFFHFLELQPTVPKAAIAGAVQFGIEQKLLKLEWTEVEIAEHFSVEPDVIRQFAEDFRAFYNEVMADDQEKEASYAFEVGSNPKANEFQNWQLLMHLKNVTITSDTSLKRQMEYYHGEPYVPKSKDEEAQLCAYETFAASTNELRAKKLESMNQFDCHIADRYLLAADSELDEKVRETLLKDAINSGKEDFEPDMDVAWLYVPNRPYLRAVFLLGIHYWEQKCFKEAFDEFYRLLQLNPGDHQGVRYLAVSALIALVRLEEAESLISHYEEKHTDNAFYSWFKWLIQRKRSLLSSATQDAFMEAIDKNPYVKKYVENHPVADPYPKSTVITPRSPEEAKLIWTFLAPGY